MSLKFNKSTVTDSVVTVLTICGGLGESIYKYYNADLLHLSRFTAL